MKQEKIPLWRDERVLQIILQLVVILIIVSVVIFLGNNLIANFQQLGLKFGFSFLSNPASFGIGDTPISYSPTDPYLKAIFIGFLNSMRVMFIGIVLATILGIGVGLGRLSNNWLVRQLATIYVQVLRNTPLLLQLFFWYFAVFLKLPSLDQGLRWREIIFLSNKGLDIPWPMGSLSTWLSLLFIVVSIVLAVLVWHRRTQVIVQQGKSGQVWNWCLGLMAIATILVFIGGLDWQYPQFNPEANAVEGGLNLAPEYATLLIGLSVYTAAYIAEVVRAGIQSVPKGQWEAAKSLGLKANLVIQLVVFPQALRVIIPPLTSEYLNLAKNSSLAIAIGYNDIYAIATTTSNQTGKSVEMLIVVMVTYLLINLIISSLMNSFNRSVQIQER